MEIWTCSVYDTVCGWEHLLYPNCVTIKRHLTLSFVYYFGDFGDDLVGSLLITFCRIISMQDAVVNINIIIANSTCVINKKIYLKSYLDITDYYFLFCIL